MALRRHATRLAAVCVMLGGLVAAGASPALAEGDSVRVRATDSFRPGGSPGAVNVEVRKRTEGCVVLRTGLGLSLAGLAANQVTAQVSLGGRWVPVPVSGGGGAVTTGRSAPTNPTLCKGKGVTMRYRLTFAAGAPGGRLTVVGEAVDGRGRAIGRGAVASRVVGPQAATPSPTPSRSPSRSPSPSPSPTAEPTTDAPTAGEPTLAAVAAEAGGAGTVAAAEEGSGGLSWIMLFGVGLVVLGVGLIVLLVRRSRADREPADDADALSGVPLPRNPGGTTYRSATPATPAPGRTPPTPGVYGRPAAPPSGGVYGSPAAPPPTGGVYGGAPSPARGDAAGPGEPPAPSGGGDATTIMPRLPG
ncbi:hypothetical protein [Micromonospora sp. WMMD712]|uniref:hypothetical protein n=1 Tax=Micromonospora sp. WMMD712 TaxID=3016096 RepID=UPI00249A785C|nr:hypothetical protein [Micromonospora sp. WMMD712]WFE60166.1 hypothetical protein O7633_26445 [Micromonospora sp. WMMD712]